MADSYFNYKDYITYKIKIFRNSVESTSTHDIDEFLGNHENIDDVKLIIKSFCMQIKEYFQYINNNFSSNYNKCCDYINYYIKYLDENTYIDPAKPISRYLRNFTYNELLSDIKSPSDNYLLAELNNIRCLIEKNELKYKVKCNTELPKLSDSANKWDYKEKCEEPLKLENTRDQIIHAIGNNDNSFSDYNTPKKVI
ncbi:variable surface protein, partial [Plasmodium gonderi]